jgi:hypothetical protein
MFPARTRTVRVDRSGWIRWVVLVASLAAPWRAAAADLVIAEKGASKAVVAVSPKAGPWEKRAAQDLAHYISRMSNVRPSLADTDAAVAAALKSTDPVLLVGSLALQADPSLRAALTKAAKKDPVLRADAIVLRRAGNRILLAGLNDDCHYYAAAELLRRWGCRWYLPTAFGECIPESPTLKVGDLDYAYGPPFEIRNYWISWNGATDGQTEFTRRNFMNYEVGVPSGHAIGQYVQELVPKGKTVFNVPISEEKTIAHVAAKVGPTFAKGEDVMLGMEDGTYASDSPRDKELQAGLWDKYFLAQALTDPFMEFYNGVAGRLAKQYPNSKSKIGFLAYSNITLPPQRKIVAEKPLVAYLAPIDIDPNHGMDDPRSPPRQEYRAMMYRWAEVMQGRLAIYDYDQGMLVWRDIPNPSFESIRQDVKHYRKAGILGVSTESRNAIATVFLNLHVRGQLYWNPDADLDALLAEFYPKFYGPAAGPMSAYWTALFNAWRDTIVTEHEYFVIPAIYTPALVAELRKHLEAAEKVVAPLKAKGDPSANEKLYLERVRFTRLTFDVLDAYTAMVRAAATEADYAAAAADGKRGLASRLELARMNPTFTTRVVGVAEETEAGGPAWWPGEVKQYRDLLAFTDGTKGRLLAKLPLEWAFRRDPNDTGLVSGWAREPVDLAWWDSQKEPRSPASRLANPGRWEMVRTDLYLQAQGVLAPDRQSALGSGWYRTDVTLDADGAKGPVHVRFPGLFNECWLYVNGHLVGHRTMPALWWLSDYQFEWDVDLAGHLKPGANTLAVRIHNPHHFGGMFRRPFLYRAVP